MSTLRTRLLSFTLVASLPLALLPACVDTPSDPQSDEVTAADDNTVIEARGNDGKDDRGNDRNDDRGKGDDRGHRGGGDDRGGKHSNAIATPSSRDGGN